MAILGDILAAARHSSGRLEQWLREADPELAKETASAASAHGLPVSGYARMAIADFSRLANEEDWATLMSSLRESADPGSTCLAAMVHWRLTASACKAHSPGLMEGNAHG
jgi:hypothetical protein